MTRTTTTLPAARPLAALALAALAACGAAPTDGGGPAGSAGAERAWSFDEVAAGALPEGFVPVHGDWSVAEAADPPSGAKALLQRAENPNSDFNLVLVEAAPPATDVDLAVRLRALSGEDDRGGGLVWRARDGGSYYVARWNPLERNLRAYHVVDGVREQVAGVEVAADPQRWHELRVVARGARARVLLDGEALLDFEDGTFPGAGRIGLWTKADAVTAFDDLVLAAPR